MVDAAKALVGEDARVRFLPFPKGERHGERSRHVALDGARGDVVCYLADDDLWLPDHVAYMCELLQSADFAVGVRLMAHPSGEYEAERVDLTYPSVRERLLAGLNNASLSTVPHTLPAYRALPFGGVPRRPASLLRGTCGSSSSRTPPAGRSRSPEQGRQQTADQR